MCRSILKFLSICVMLLLITFQNVKGLRCIVGISVYSVNKTIYFPISEFATRVEVCGNNDNCGRYSWINTDTVGARSFVERGFCAEPNQEYNCDILPSEPGVGNVDDCTTTICSTDECNQFRSPVCNLGVAAYTLDRTTAIFPTNVRKDNCQPGETCAMYRWTNTNAAGFMAYVEAGLCEGPENNRSCALLPSFPDVGTITNCSFESCSGNECEAFSIAFPQGRGFQCSRGTMVYSTDRSRVILSRNIMTEPCAQWQACAMYRWINTDDAGTRTYAEHGFCLNQIQLASFSCETLPQLPDVGQVESCTFNVCSGDGCQSFTGRSSLLKPSRFILLALFLAVAAFWI